MMKTVNKAVLPILIIFTLLACSEPMIMLSEDLNSETTSMEVKGKQGRNWNQVIRYGDFETSKVRRGWTTETDVGSNFTLRFRDAKNKLRFTQRGPAGEARVYAVGNLKSADATFLKNIFGESVSLTYKDSFSGTIIPGNDEAKSWEFVVGVPDGERRIFTAEDLDNIETGVAKNKEGEEIIIYGVRRLEHQVDYNKVENHGFEFVYKDQAIAAVSLINNGKVWMKNSIPDNLKLIIAGISTSLLVRESLEE